MRILFIAVSAMLIAALTFGGSCDKSVGDKLVGEWVGVDNPAIDWVRVSRTADGYVWECPEGKYEAVMEGHLLNIDFEGFPAYAAYDKDTGQMSFIVHGSTVNYRKKE